MTDAQLREGELDSITEGHTTGYTSRQTCATQQLELQPFCALKLAKKKLRSGCESTIGAHAPFCTHMRDLCLLADGAEIDSFWPVGVIASDGHRTLSLIGCTCRLAMPRLCVRSTELCTALIVSPEIMALNCTVQAYMLGIA